MIGSTVSNRLRITLRRGLLWFSLLLVLTPGAMLLGWNQEKTEAQTATACGGSVYCQNLLGTGQSAVGVKRVGNLSSNTPAVNGDPNWQINRIYSDAFYNNSPPTNSFPAPGSAVAPAGSGNNPATSTCQYFTAPTPAAKRGIIVDEFPGSRAGQHPSGTINPWAASGQARWLGVNYLGWHDGFGGGKFPWPGATTCDDPSMYRYFCIPLPAFMCSGFSTMDKWPTFVFRYTVNTSNIPANVNMASLRLEMVGSADNHMGVTVNNQPMNIQCSGRLANTYEQFNDPFGNPLGPPNELWGQGDPNYAGTSRYLPLCTPGFDPGNTVIIASQRVAGTFVSGSNTIEIHIKSAYSNVGLMLSQIRIVGNIMSAPTCSSVSFTRGGVATASVPAGATFRALATFNNPAPSNLSVSNVSYSIAGMPVPGSANTSDSYNNPGDIAAGGSRSYGSPTPPDTIVIPQAGTYTITWTMQSANGTVNCTGTINVTTQAPTCDASTILFFSGGVATSTVTVGQAFRTQVTITNPNPLPMTVSSVRYSFAGVPVADPNTSNIYNNPGNIPANGSRAYSSNQTPEDIRISAAGTYTITWTIDAGGVVTNCGTDTITVTILPPTCTASSKNVIVGLPFDISASVTNPNNFAPLTITGPANKFTLLTAPNQTGGASPATPVVIAGAGNTGFTSPATLVVNSAGVYTVNWSFTSAVGNANCSAIITASNQPYARFYGNDVVAGGSFKSAGVCAPAGPAANITMPSAYKPATPTNHATFVGSGSELAVVATGAIRGLLPGSQVTGRGSVGELAFANNVPAAPVGAGTREFGGGFNETLCLEELPTTAASPVVGPVDLNTLASGTYQAASLRINASTISDSKKLTIIVSGDVIIDGAITYAGSGSWASIGAIPLVRIYANNISVVGGVPTLDGLYVARNNFYTCTQNNGSIFASIANANNADDGPYLAACTNKLTVNGAVIAKDIYLHRAVGNIGGATTTVAEGASDPDIAESFNFSPELYLALLAEGAGNLGGRFDSILSLPPAF